MSKYTIRQEPARSLYVEGLAKGIFTRHLDEVGFGKSDVTLNIDIDQIEKSEAEGTHVVFVARNLGNEVVGYIGFVMFLSSYLSKKTAQAYTTFVVPEHRKDGIAAQLVKYAESVLYHDYGCTYVQLTSNLNKEISGFIEKMGYTPTDMVYTKEFERSENGKLQTI